MLALTSRLGFGARELSQGKARQGKGSVLCVCVCVCDAVLCYIGCTSSFAKTLSDQRAEEPTGLLLLMLLLQLNRTRQASEGDA